MPMAMDVICREREREQVKNFQLSHTQQTQNQTQLASCYKSMLENQRFIKPTQHFLSSSRIPNHSLSLSTSINLQLSCLIFSIPEVCAFMASKVPQFGAWEGGENYTVYFENARKTKSNGQMINPNDPQDNPDMFPKNGIPTQTPATPSRAESQGQQSKVPQFGAWDTGDNVGYTAYFENARKNKTAGPTTADNPAQTQARHARIKPEVQEPRTKVPQFGAWNEGENVPYTAYFDNARKNKNDGTGATTVEPQLNRDPADRGRTPHAATKTRPEEQLSQGGGVGSRLEQRSTKEEGPVRSTSPPSVNGSETPSRHGRQTAGGQTPQHSRGAKTQLKPVGRGSQNSEKGAAIPQFGVWNTDPSQAEGFTGAFMRAKMTPLNNDTSASQQHQTHQSKEPKKGCCCPWFG